MDDFSSWTNDSNSSSCSKTKDHDLLNMVVIPVLYVVVSTLICIGNVLVLDCYRKVDSARTVTNVFIVQLAIADLWVGLTLPFISSFYIVRKMRLLEDVHRLCVFSYTLFILPASASVLGLLLMTLDRFLSILYPLRYRVKMNKRKAYALAVLIVWFPAIGGAFVLPNIWRMDLSDAVNNTGIICKNYANCDLVKDLKKEYIQYVFVPCFVLFAVVIFILYLPILHTVRKHLAQHKSHLEKGTTTPFTRNTIQRKEIKMMTTIILILGAFFVCWMPLMGILAAEVYFQKDFSKWRGYLYIPTMLNSALNPIIYALRVPAFNQLLCQKFPCLKPLQMERTSESGRINSRSMQGMNHVTCQELGRSSSTPSLDSPQLQNRVPRKIIMKAAPFCPNRKFSAL